jgi:putative membrane protein
VWDIAVSACLAAIAHAAVTPGGVWRAWSFDPLVVAFLVVATYLYVAGIRRLWSHGRTGRGVSTSQVAAFAGAMAALVVALASPLDAMAEALLSAHMGQHFMLLMVAGPLLVLAAPEVAMPLAVPRGVRRRVRRLGHRPALRAAGRTLTHPVAAWTVALVVLWTWHAPALYQAALRNDLVHGLEHVTFVGSAMLFWWPVLHPGRGLRRLPRGADIVYVVTGGLQGAALGALFTFAASPLYPLYRGPATAWGLTPLQDQQLAGVIMWIPSGLVYLVAAGGLFVHWLREMERDARALEAKRPIEGRGTVERVATRWR